MSLPCLTIIASWYFNGIAGELCVAGLSMTHNDSAMFYNVGN